MQRTFFVSLTLLGFLVACDPSSSKDEPGEEVKSDGAAEAEPGPEPASEPTPAPAPAPDAEPVPVGAADPAPVPSPEPDVPKVRVNSLSKAGIDGMGVFTDWATIEKRWGSAIPTVAPAEETEATGCTETGWKFPTKGIEVFGCGKGTERTVYALALTSTSKLATTAGVKIGDELSDITAAYSKYGGPQHQGTAKADGLGWEWTEDSDAVVIYDYEARMSLQFTLQGGKVSRVDLSSMGE